jgi:hypothetical protein
MGDNDSGARGNDPDTRGGAESHRLQVEVERLAIERDRLAMANAEQNFFRKHAGEVIAGAVALAGILVSAANIKVAYVQKEKELELQRIQKRTEMDLQKLQKDAELEIQDRNARAKLEQDRDASSRDYEYKWKYDMLQFVDKHSDKVFSSKPEDVERVQSIMLVSFPPKQVSLLFESLKKAATDDVQKKAWEHGAKIAYELTNEAKVEVTPVLPGDKPPQVSPGSVPITATSCSKFPSASDITAKQCRIACWDKGQTTRYNTTKIVSQESEMGCETAALRWCRQAGNSFCAYAWGPPP